VLLGDTVGAGGAGKFGGGKVGSDLLEPYGEGAAMDPLRLGALLILR
jgi:hypothetical protein